MTAFHSMILSALGEPLTPAGGSEASRLKSRMRRRLATVDWDVSSGTLAGVRRVKGTVRASFS
jgi:hypothetical protein